MRGEKETTNAVCICFLLACMHWAVRFSTAYG
jgi:hypothetical protein